MEYTTITPHAYAPSQPAVKASQPQADSVLGRKDMKKFRNKPNGMEKIFLFPLNDWGNSP